MRKNRFGLIVGIIAVTTVFAIIFIDYYNDRFKKPVYEHGDIVSLSVIRDGEVEYKVYENDGAYRYSYYSDETGELIYEITKMDYDCFMQNDLNELLEDKEKRIRNDRCGEKTIIEFEDGAVVQVNHSCSSIRIFFDACRKSTPDLKLVQRNVSGHIFADERYILAKK